MRSQFSTHRNTSKHVIADFVICDNALSFTNVITFPLAAWNTLERPAGSQHHTGSQVLSLSLYCCRCTSFGDLFWLDQINLLPKALQLVPDIMNHGCGQTDKHDSKQRTGWIKQTVSPNNWARLVFVFLWSRSHWIKDKRMERATI